MKLRATDITAFQKRMHWCHMQWWCQKMSLPSVVAEMYIQLLSWVTFSEDKLGNWCPSCFGEVQFQETFFKWGSEIIMFVLFGLFLNRSVWVTGRQDAACWEATKTVFYRRACAQIYIKQTEYQTFFVISWSYWWELYHGHARAKKPSVVVEALVSENK